jgi:hypothetical protein
MTLARQLSTSRNVMVAVSNWMHVDFFTLDQAAALWCKCDPSQVGSYKNSNPPEFDAVKQLLVGGITGESLVPNDKLTPYSQALNFSDVLVSRLELEKFARSKQLFPAFLFDTLAPFEKPESPLDRYNKLAIKLPVTAQPAKPVNQGGRPLEYDWDSFMLEVVRIANTLDGLPDSQADLVREMQEWFSATTDSEPAESSIKLRTSKIYKYLTEQKEKVKNPNA